MKGPVSVANSIHIPIYYNMNEISYIEDNTSHVCPHDHIYNIYFNFKHYGLWYRNITYT